MNSVKALLAVIEENEWTVEDAISHLSIRAALSADADDRSIEHVRVAEYWGRWKLTKTEAVIAEILYRARGKPVSSSAIMDALYFARTDEELPSGRVLQVFMFKARQKLPPEFNIRTVRGKGYQMDVTPARAANFANPAKAADNRFDYWPHSLPEAC